MSKKLSLRLTPMKQAIQRAKDKHKPVVLTQDQVHEKFPDRGYDDYGKCIVVAGSAASIKKNVTIKATLVVQTISGTVEIPLKHEISIEELSWFGDSNLSEDVTKQNDTRIVVWK